MWFRTSAPPELQDRTSGTEPGWDKHAVNSKARLHITMYKRCLLSKCLISSFGFSRHRGQRCQFPLISARWVTADGSAAELMRAKQKGHSADRQWNRWQLSMFGSRDTWLDQHAWNTGGTLELHVNVCMHVCHLGCCVLLEGWTEIKDYLWSKRS